jgi:hypothetical protein
MEVAQGISIGKIRARLQGGQVDEEKQESSGNGKPKLDKAGSQSRKSSVKLPRISRKKWSTDELFNRFTPGAKGSGTSAPPKELTLLQKAAQKLEAVDGSEVILKQFFRAGNEDLLVSLNFLLYYTGGFCLCSPVIIFVSSLDRLL